MLYQIVGGVRKPVSGGYHLKDARTAGFEVGEYDHTLPLVIDPYLNYSTSTYFGGNAGDAAMAVKVLSLDTNFFIYVAGETLSTTFAFTIPDGNYAAPLTNQFHGGTINGDGFVAKFQDTGSNLALVYFTYLGGSGNDGVLDMAVDTNGNAYVTGFTDSTNFPVFPATGIPNLLPNHGTSISGTLDPKLHVYPMDAFVAELGPDGTNLVYSAYLGGSDRDIAGGIVVDPAGYAYVTGYTFSTNFPTVNALIYNPAVTTNSGYHLAGSNDVFVTKIAPNGTNLVYSTYLGGTNIDEGEGIAADAGGYAYVTGYTGSTNFPTTAGAFQKYYQLNDTTNAVIIFQNVLAVPFDAFVAKIDINGTNLLYCTLLGGTNTDAGIRIALDANTNVYVAGSSESPDFPNTATNVPGLSVGITNSSYPNSDAFLTKITMTNITNGVMAYSALFGGTNNDVGWGVAVDPNTGNAYVVGITSSTNFPTWNVPDFLRATNSGSNDVFVTVFNTNASALICSVYLGGSANDYGYGITVDSAGNAYIVGTTLSTNFVVTNAFYPTLAGTNDSFLAKISMETTLTNQVSGNSLVLAWPAFSPELKLESKTNYQLPGGWLPVPSRLF